MSAILKGRMSAALERSVKVDLAPVREKAQKTEFKGVKSRGTSREKLPSAWHTHLFDTGSHGGVAVTTSFDAKRRQTLPVHSTCGWAVIFCDSSSCSGRCIGF
jgi:hypothetical protein